MRKRIIIFLIVAVLVVCGAASASAQLRLDLDVNIPVYVGFTASGTAQGVWNQYFIPFPDARLSYEFGLGPVTLGAGARLFTVIIENLVYPELYGEFTLGKFVASANLGGLFFLGFGLLSDLLDSAGVGNLTGYQPLLLPDLDVAFNVTDWFRLGGGCSSSPRSPARAASAMSCRPTCSRRTSTPGSC